MFSGISKLFGGTGIMNDEEAFKMAEEQFAKRRATMTAGKKINAVPAATTSAAGTATPGTTAARGEAGAVTIHINGGDIDKVRKVVREEIYNSRKA